MLEWKILRSKGEFQKRMCCILHKCSQNPIRQLSSIDNLELYSTKTNINEDIFNIQKFTWRFVFKPPITQISLFHVVAQDLYTSVSAPYVKSVSSSMFPKYDNYKCDNYKCR